MNKVYAILYYAYEFDDLNYGDYHPIYFSLDKEKIIEKFNNMKNDELKHFNNIVKDYINDENYQIDINIDNELVLFIGKWCYNYKLNNIFNTLLCYENIF